MNKSEQTSGFFGLGIAPNFFETLEKLNFKTPTPIQQQAIPIAIEGKDVVGVAQTGTGKTMAFGIPMLQRLVDSNGRGLVVVPTRELAMQVDEALHKVGVTLELRTAIIIGGTSIGPQIRAISRDPHVIIATPGRLNDHLQQKTIKLDRIKVVVLDEADRMLDMGFAPQIKKIMNMVPSDRQTMLFSATMPPEIMRMASAYMKTPIRIEVAPAGSTAENVTQEIFVVQKDEKPRLTEKILQQYSGTTLIFTKTKYGAKRLTRLIKDMGHTAVEIHSNRSLNQRIEAIEGFKSGKYRILIATDIASRGIDVTGIELVLNFDLPTNTEDYIHRIGRTARAGAGGHAISFVGPEQRRDLKSIERLVRKTLHITPTPTDLPPMRVVTEEREERGFRGRGRRDSGGRGVRSSSSPRENGPKERRFGSGHGYERDQRYGRDEHKDVLQNKGYDGRKSLSYDPSLSADRPSVPKIPNHSKRQPHDSVRPPSRPPAHKYERRVERLVVEDKPVSSPTGLVHGGYSKPKVAKPVGRTFGKPDGRPMSKPFSKPFGKPEARSYSRGPVSSRDSRPMSKPYGRPDSRPSRPYIPTRSVGSSTSSFTGRPASPARSTSKPFGKPFGKPFSKPFGKSFAKPFGKAPIDRPYRPTSRPASSSTSSYTGRPARPTSRPVGSSVSGYTARPARSTSRPTGRPSGHGPSYSYSNGPDRGGRPQGHGYGYPKGPSRNGRPFQGNRKRPASGSRKSYN